MSQVRRLKAALLIRVYVDQDVLDPDVEGIKDLAAYHESALYDGLTSRLYLGEQWQWELEDAEISLSPDPDEEAA